LLSQVPFRFNGDSAIAIEIRPGHYFFNPETSSPSADAIKELHRIASISSVAAIVESRHPIEPFLNVDAILKYGARRNFPYVSLFRLDATAITEKTIALCPHSTAASVNDELYAYIATVLGSTARAFSLRQGVCLCAFFGHAFGDAELIATQITRTLARVLSIKDTKRLATGPYASFKLSDDEAGAAIGSFIDGLR
jgi:hypothetical protein